MREGGSHNDESRELLEQQVGICGVQARRALVEHVERVAALRAAI
jgi:hypothetical protein